MVLDEQVKEQDAALLQLEKMSALGMLAAGVAHEINNPMTYLSANMEAVKKYCMRITQLLDYYQQLEEKALAHCIGPLAPILETIATFKQKQRMDFIVSDLAGLADDCLEGVNHVSGIVKDLRHFLRAEDDDREKVDINKTIDMSLNIIWHEIKYRIKVVRRYSHLPPVACYPGKIGQVFMNVLLNAGQSIEGEGTITVSTVHRPGEDPDDDGFVKIIIEDTGMGIAAHHHDKIFDPFFTTKPVGVGTGLGLSVCYQIVKNHGGNIFVASREGHGSQFTITLPVGGCPK